MLPAAGRAALRLRRGGSRLARGRDRRSRADIRSMHVGRVDRHRRRLDCREVGAGRLGDAARQRREFHGLQEADQLRAVRRLQREIVEAIGDRHVVLERHQVARDPRLVGIGDDGLAALLLLDLGGARQQRVEVAIGFQELCRGLRPDARNARHVVDRVAGHRLQVDHLLGRHAPLLDHLGDADLAVLHRVVHRHRLADELHQILVRRDDRRIGADLAGQPRIGGDQIVGLEAFHLDAGQVEGARRLADQPELRDQILRRRRAIGLVFGVEVVAEGFGGIVENHREMRRRHPHRGVARILQQLPHHVAETQHGADRQPVGFAVERRQRMVGAEDVAGAVDEEQMVALFHGENA